LRCDNYGRLLLRGRVSHWNTRTESKVPFSVQVLLACTGIAHGATGAFGAKPIRCLRASIISSVRNTLVLVLVVPHAGIDVLSTATSEEFTRLGINLTASPAAEEAPIPTAFVDTAHTGTAGPRNGPNATNPGTNVVPLWQLQPILIDSMPHTINITVLVDGASCYCCARLRLRLLISRFSWCLSRACLGKASRFRRPS